MREAVPDHEGERVNVAIVDYGSGNLHSARKAFERAAREAGLSGTITITRDPDAVFRADRIVLPGVGAFADCRRGLDRKSTRLNSSHIQKSRMPSSA